MRGRRDPGSRAAAGVLAVLAVAGTLVLPAAQASAVESACPPPRCSEHSITLGRFPFRFNVLLPPGYDADARRYPVLYLFSGGAGGHGFYQDRWAWLLGTDLVDWTASLPANRQAIVVLPDHGAVFDSLDGTMRWETFHIRHLIPYVDANFRTIPDRAYRAIAGLSLGGYGAMHHAARHPDLFAAAGSFSGAPLHLGDPRWVALAQTMMVGLATVCPAYAGGDDPWLCGGYDPAPGSPIGPLGSYATHEVWWRGNDATELAGNLGGVEIFAGAGNGVPCDAEDARVLAAGGRTEDGEIVYSHLESGAEPQLRDFSAALTRAGVPHTTHVRSCGIHSWRYFWRDLAAFWPRMFAAFGSPPPASFDHRAVEAAFEGWGWRFEADPHRAAEFLDVANASCSGLGLRGSGRTTVTTARCFRPGARVLVDGVPHRADASGRVRFGVDLGPAHPHQQFTPAAHALEAAGGYWRSHRVRLRG